MEPSKIPVFFLNHSTSHSSWPVSIRQAPFSHSHLDRRQSVIERCSPTLLTGILFSMMSSFKVLLPIFSVLLGSIIPAVALDRSTVQLDLVFPRNGSVYKPVYPFPIVFAIHNAAIAWPHSFLFDWSIYARQDNGSTTDTDSGGFSVDKAQNQSFPDQFLFINSSSIIINTTSTRFFLRTSFGITNNCSSDTAPDRTEWGYVHPGEPVWFYLSPDGELPNIMNVTDCPKTLSTFGIQGTYNSALGKTPSCPVLTQPPSPPKENCAFKVDAEVARQVESAMLQTASCTSGSWPNATGLIRHCTRQNQSAAVGRISFEFPLVVLFTLLLGIAVIIYKF